MFIIYGKKPRKRVVKMSKKRFVPYFHHCKDGNHYHLVTGPDLGASPAFVSLFNAELLLKVAVDPNEQQVLRDLARLRRKLKTLKVKSGRRNRGLWVRDRPWERHVGKCWCDLLNGTLWPDETTALLYFTKTPCDFVEKKRNEIKLSLRARKVSEVKRVRC